MSAPKAHLWHRFFNESGMLKKVNLVSSLRAGALAALLFCVTAFIYIQSADYTLSWILYVGSFLFLIVIWVHTMQENRKRKENESTVSLVFASHVTTIIGVFISCAICFILLAVMIPGYFSSDADKVLTSEPGNTIIDRTEGLSSHVFIAATLVNFSVGSFAGIILPFYAKRNQTRDSREPTPLHQHGVK